MDNIGNDNDKDNAKSNDTFTDDHWNRAVVVVVVAVMVFLLLLLCLL